MAENTETPVYDWDGADLSFLNLDATDHSVPGSHIQLSNADVPAQTNPWTLATAAPTPLPMDLINQQLGVPQHAGYLHVNQLSGASPWSNNFPPASYTQPPVQTIQLSYQQQLQLGLLGQAGWTVTVHDHDWREHDRYCSKAYLTGHLNRNSRHVRKRFQLTAEQCNLYPLVKSSRGFQRSQTFIEPSHLIDKNHKSPSSTMKAPTVDSKGVKVLGNHLLVERILMHLPCAQDVLNLSRATSRLLADVHHYHRRNATELDFSTSRIPEKHVRNFIREFSNENVGNKRLQFAMGRWELLTSIDFSNCGITSDMLSHIVAYTFKDINLADFLPKFRPRTSAHPECFPNLTCIKAYGCVELDGMAIVELIERLLNHKLREWWAKLNAERDPDDPVTAQGHVNSILQQKFWRGPVPSTVSDIDDAQLAGYTSLKQLFLANSAELAIVKRFWQGSEFYWNVDKCPFTSNIAKCLTVLGTLGIESDLRFCSSYCSTYHAFTEDDWEFTPGDDHELVNDMFDDLENDFTWSNHKILRTKAMPDFSKMAIPKDVMRLPHEIKIDHPESGRTYYYPRAGKPPGLVHIDLLELSNVLLAESTINVLVRNFDSYTFIEKVKAINYMGNYIAPVPPKWKHPNPLTPTESYHAYLFRLILEKYNCRYPVRFQIPFDVNIACPTAQVATELALRNFEDIERIIRRLLRNPLPRRLMLRSYSPMFSDSWESTTPAIPEHPRGLCCLCEREVWLCERCNRVPRAYCAECMTDKVDAAAPFAMF